MKAPIALALAACLASAQAQEVEVTEAEPPDQELSEWQQDFLNLAPEKRGEFQRHLNKSRDLFRQKRIFECLEELGKAHAIFPDSPDVLNLQGACQVEFRDFEGAMKYYRKALELEPENPSILFNVGEIHFVSNEWEKAEQVFGKVLEKVGDEKESLPMARLVEFKMMLCKIKLGRIEEARQLAGKYDYFDDSPFPYYAEAALAFHDEESVKAEQALARARRIFRGAGDTVAWDDTMMEFGYIKSFFGGDLEEEE